jgi:serine protease
MRRLFVIALLIVAGGAGLFAPQSTGSAQSPSPRIVDRHSIAGQTGTEFAGNDITVRFQPAASLADVWQQSGSHGGRILKVAPRSGLYTIELPKDANAESVLADYRSSPVVAEAGRTLVARAFGAPNDTNYSYQWHLQNTVGGMWAEGAWDLSANKGAGVVVAVIDTGLAYETYSGSYGGVFAQTFSPAPDLAGTTIVAPWDFTRGSSHANDDNGHGSHVTGTIRQTTNNAYGVAGVAYNSSIMPLKILDYSGSGADADLVSALYYAVDHGAKVISMSLGFMGTGAPDANGNVCTEVVGLNAALDYAYQHNVVVVAAAGNDASTTVSCPAAYPTVIAVGATRFDGQVAPYSNGGPALDITAPGGDPNVDQNHDGFSDGVLQETYCYDSLTLLFLGSYDAFCDIFMSGTSMATPHVSGTAALLLGENPSLTPGQVRNYLQSTARDRGAPGWDPVYGWGVLDARAALAALTGAATPSPTAMSTVTDTPTSTFTPNPTNTPTSTATYTSIPTATNTSTPTATNTSTPTPTYTSTPTQTDTRTPTATYTKTPTSTPILTRTPSATPSPTPKPWPCADFNGDGVITVADILFEIQYFQSANLTGDLNGDGRVTVADILIVVSEFGVRCHR